MKVQVKSLAAAVAVMVTMLVAASHASAGTSAYTCRYAKGSGVTRMTIVITGSDLTPSLCRVFNDSFGGRRVASAPQRSYCSWRLIVADVRVSVRAPNSAAGRLACLLLGDKLRGSSDWIRTR